jgi:hypothetical protein
MGIILDIVKTLLAKDTDPESVNKPFYLRRKYWGIGITVMGGVLYSHWGLVLDSNMKDIILDNIQVIVNDVQSLIAAIGVLYGLFLGAKGQVGHTQKLVTQNQVLTDKVTECTKVITTTGNSNTVNVSAPAEVSVVDVAKENLDNTLGKSVD